MKALPGGSPSSRQVGDDQEFQGLKKAAADHGVQVLVGRWAGKGGWAILHGRRVVVLDRGLPDPYKWAVLKALLESLDQMVAEKDEHSPAR